MALGISGDAILGQLMQIHGNVGQDKWLTPIAQAMSELSGKPIQNISSALMSLHKLPDFVASIDNLI